MVDGGGRWWTVVKETCTYTCPCTLSFGFFRLLSASFGFFLLSPPDEYDRPADEEEFRNVMKNVWATDAERASTSGLGNDALNAFGSAGGMSLSLNAC